MVDLYDFAKDNYLGRRGLKYEERNVETLIHRQDLRHDGASTNAGIFQYMTHSNPRRNA